MSEPEEDPREINSILHDQWRNNNSLLDAQSHILGYLRPDPFAGVNIFDDELIARLFTSPVSHLQRALGRAIDHVGDDPTTRSISINSWNEIRDVLSELLNAEALGRAPLPLRLRELAVKIRKEIDLLKNQSPKARLNKERTNDVLACANEIERLVCVFDLRRAIEMTKLTNERIFSLLQLSRRVAEAVVGPLDVDDIVTEVTEHYRDQASSRGIILKIKEYSRGACVNVARPALTTALGNLIDNAIKYTGKLPAESVHKNTWIDIRIIRRTNAVSIRIESWGIPITDEERKGDFVFKQHYRGWFARKTSIKGSGTGLADVKDFATKIGGSVSFDSVPVNKAADIRFYTTTTVTLTLPLTGV